MPVSFPVSISVIWSFTAFSLFLFSGALHVYLSGLYTAKWSVTILSPLGTIIATFFIGALFWFAAYVPGYELRFNDIRGRED
jgi:CPA1 family monovalent cation:H+ antiporter